MTAWAVGIPECTEYCSIREGKECYSLPVNRLAHKNDKRLAFALMNVYVCYDELLAKLRCRWKRGFEWLCQINGIRLVCYDCWY